MSSRILSIKNALVAAHVVTTDDTDSSTWLGWSVDDINDFYALVFGAMIPGNDGSGDVGFAGATKFDGLADAARIVLTDIRYTLQNQYQNWPGASGVADGAAWPPKAPMQGLNISGDPSVAAAWRLAAENDWITIAKTCVAMCLPAEDGGISQQTWANLPSDDISRNVGKANLDWTTVRQLAIASGLTNTGSQHGPFIGVVGTTPSADVYAKAYVPAEGRSDFSTLAFLAPAAPWSIAQSSNTSGAFVDDIALLPWNKPLDWNDVTDEASFETYMNVAIAAAGGHTASSGFPTGTPAPGSSTPAPPSTPSGMKPVFVPQTPTIPGLTFVPAHRPLPPLIFGNLPSSATGTGTGTGNTGTGTGNTGTDGTNGGPAPVTVAAPAPAATGITAADIAIVAVGAGVGAGAGALFAGKKNKKKAAAIGAVLGFVGGVLVDWGMAPKTTVSK